MKGKSLPYFLTISSTIFCIKILSLHFLPTLSSFILLPYKTNKRLWSNYGLLGKTI